MPYGKKKNHAQAVKADPKEISAIDAQMATEGNRIGMEALAGLDSAYKTTAFEDQYLASRKQVMERSLAQQGNLTTNTLLSQLAGRGILNSSATANALTGQVAKAQFLGNRSIEEDQFEMAQQFRAQRMDELKDRWQIGNAASNSALGRITNIQGLSVNRFNAQQQEEQLNFQRKKANVDFGMQLGKMAIDAAAAVGTGGLSTTLKSLFSLGSNVAGGVAQGVAGTATRTPARRGS